MRDYIGELHFLSPLDCTRMNSMPFLKAPKRYSQSLVLIPETDDPYGRGNSGREKRCGYQVTGQGLAPERQFLTSPGDGLYPVPSFRVLLRPQPEQALVPVTPAPLAPKTPRRGRGVAGGGGAEGGRRGRGFCSRTRRSATPRSCPTSDFPLLSPKMIPKPTQRQGGS